MILCTSFDFILFASFIYLCRDLFSIFQFIFFYFILFLLDDCIKQCFLRINNFILVASNTVLMLLRLCKWRSEDVFLYHVTFHEGVFLTLKFPYLVLCVSLRWGQRRSLSLGGELFLICVALFEFLSIDVVFVFCFFD